MNIAAMGNDIFSRLCNVLEAGALAQDERFRTVRLRAANRLPLSEAIAARTRTRPTRQWIDMMNRAGVPCGPILRMDDVFADPQVAHLGMRQPLAHPALGDIAVLGRPVVLSRTIPATFMPAPEAGQHNGDVYGRMLTMDSERLAALAARGVV